MDGWTDGWTNGCVGERAQTHHHQNPPHPNPYPYPNPRDYFLQPSNYPNCRTTLVSRFGELMRKMWNPANFKGQVSPHEFMQAVIIASKRRFTIDAQVGGWGSGGEGGGRLAVGGGEGVLRGSCWREDGGLWVSESGSGQGRSLGCEASKALSLDPDPRHPTHHPKPPTLNP